MRNLTEIVELIRSGQKDTARTALLEYIAVHPKDVEAWLYLGSCAKDKEEFAECIQTALGIDPTQSTALKLAKKYEIPIAPPVMTPLPAQVTPTPPPHSAPRAKKSSRLGLWLGIFVLLVATVGLGSAFFFLAADRATEEDTSTYQTEEAEIIATNDALGTAVYQEATDMSATLAAP